MIDRFLTWNVDGILGTTIDYLLDSIWGRLVAILLIPLLIPFCVCLLIGVMCCGPPHVIWWIIKGER